MPLSAAASRRPIHTRAITCQAFLRGDDLWDIEGRLTDTKTYGFPNKDRGRIAPGEPVHDMSIRLTVDGDFHIRAVEAVTDAAPFTICPAITGAFQCLVGLSLGPGFNREVRRRLGGVAGCTHLVDLLGPMATTAHQAIWPFRQARPEDPPGEAAPGRRPRHLDTCHALASDGPVVKREWPEFYAGGE